MGVEQINRVKQEWTDLPIFGGLKAHHRVARRRPANRADVEMYSGALAVQEAERWRIASELHDGLGQTLTLMSIELANVTKLLQSGLEPAVTAVPALIRMRQKLQDAFDELRRTVMGLRPSLLDDLGLLPTLDWFAREFHTVGTGILIEKTVEALESDIPSRLKIVIFRVVQESVTNTVKFAQASRIGVRLTASPLGIELCIEDNGRGFDVAKMRRRQGSGGGIANIFRRCVEAGGVCTLDSSGITGTRIKLVWSPNP